MKKRILFTKFCCMVFMVQYTLTSAQISPPTTQITSEIGYFDLGDYDFDNDYDLLYSDLNGTLIYQNDGNGNFSAGALINSNFGDVEWADMDNDGDLDFVQLVPNLVVYINSNGSFAAINSSFGCSGVSSLVLADYTNDGAIDAAVWCENEGIWLFTNNGGGTLSQDTGFSFNFPPTLSSVIYPQDLNWIDFDNDGSLDLTFSLTYVSNPGGLFLFETYVLLNTTGNGSGFTDSGLRINGVSNDWSDLDGDGDLDLLCGIIDNQIEGKLYFNQGNNTFSEFVLNTPRNGMSKFADFDNDGDTDFVLLGSNDSQNNPGRIWENLGNNNFTLTQVEMYLSYTQGTTDYDISDLDADGDLDMMYSGRTLTGISPPTYISATTFIENIFNGADNPPTAPTGLGASFGGCGSTENLTITWNAATDDLTNTSQLTYNVRIGTSSGGNEILSAMTQPNGTPLKANRGNAGYQPSITINGLDPSIPYYISVQAIDNGYKTSAFSQELVFFNNGGSGYYTDALTIPNVGVGPSSWLDYDNDGDLDFLTAGEITLVNGQPTVGMADIYRNNNGNFTPANIGLTPIRQGEATWVDFDNDLDYDIALMGLNPSGNPILELYENNNGSFSLVSNSGLTGGFYNGGMDWGHFDNNGFPDLLITGTNTNGQPETQIFTNANGNFTPIGSNVIAPLQNGDVSWLEYSANGTDFVVTGEDMSGQPQTAFYVNTNGTVVEDTTGLGMINLTNSSLDHGSYRAGFDQWMIAGKDTSGNSNILGYIGSNIDYIISGMPNVENPQAIWTDYDNDGDDDVVISGKLRNSNQVFTRLFSNNNGTYNPECGLLPIEGNAMSNLETIDYDMDGDLDLMLTTFDASNQSYLKIYRNDGATTPNTSPEIPLNIALKVSCGVLKASWDAPNDDMTPSNNINYRMTVQNNDVQLFNDIIGNNTSFEFDLNPISDLTTVTASIMAIDNGLANSATATFPTVAQDNEIRYFVERTTITSTYQSPYRPFIQGVGDFNNDSLIDVVLTPQGTTDVVRLINQGGFNFTEQAQTIQAEPGLSQISTFSSIIADYNKDNDPDIIVHMDSLVGSNYNPAKALINSNGSSFTYVDIPIIPITKEWIQIKDFNNDGVLDGYQAFHNYDRDDAHIFFGNTNLGFDSPIGFFNALQFADVNKDGLTDFVEFPIYETQSVYPIPPNPYPIQIQTQTDGFSFNPFGIVFNDFVFENSSQPDDFEAFSIEDFDNDGYPEILDFFDNSIFPNKLESLRIYKNNGVDGFLSPTVYTLPQNGYSKYFKSFDDFHPLRAIGDYNNDGLKDFLEYVIRHNYNGIFSRDIFVFINNGNLNFEMKDICTIDPEIDLISGTINYGIHDLDFADFDNDNDLDLLVVKFYPDTGTLTYTFYENTNTAINTKPLPPTAVTAYFNSPDTTLRFNWYGASDNQTPTPGLSYNIRIGKTPGGTDVVSPLSFISTDPALDGRRKIVEKGNVELSEQWRLTNITLGQDYYWAVQAIDNSYIGSVFSPEQVVASNRANSTGLITGNVVVPSSGNSVQATSKSNGFNQNSNVEGYRLELIDVLSPTNDTLLVDISDANGYFDFKQVPNGQYRIHVPHNSLVMAVDNPTLTINDTTQAIDVTVEIGPNDIKVILETLGLNEESLENTVNIFPNPTNGILNITLPVINQNLGLEVYDIMGKTLLQKQLKPNDHHGVFALDVSGLSTGMYFLKLNNESASVSKKFIKE